MKPAIKRLLFLALKLSVSGSLMYLVLQRVGAAKVGRALTSVSPAAFALAIALFFVIIAVCTARWRILLMGRFPYRRLFPLYLVGSFFNVFLPGLVGGDVIKIYYLYKDGGSGTEAMASVFMDRYMGYAGLMALGLAAYPFGYAHIAGTWAAWMLPACVGLFAVASLVLFKARIGSGIKAVGEVYGHFAAYSKERRVLMYAFWLAIIIHVINVATVYILAVGLGLDVPIAAVCVFVPIVATLAALPISLSGVGLREAAMVLLFGKLGVPAETATALSFLWFLTNVAGGIPGAFVYMTLKTGKKSAKN